MKKLIDFLRKPHFFQRLWKKIVSLFHFEQWTLMVMRRNDESIPAWDEFKSIMPPLDRFWADPFPWEHNGKQYLFYEELLFSNNRGHISCMTLNENLDVIKNEVVLQRPYHLSYPFLFKYENNLYMTPESYESNAIELYQCVEFPGKWEFKKTLIPNIRAVDATLLEANGKWWMFANIFEEGGSSHDTLHLYYSSNPIAGSWTPHPSNPIVKNIKNARPAGRIFLSERGWIRPAQDCSQRYGYAINFNRIIVLNEKEYTETTETTFLPPKDKKSILATHTWNKMGNLLTSDAQYWRRKF